MSNEKLAKLTKYAPKVKIKKLKAYEYIQKNEELIKLYKIPVQLDNEITLQNTKAYITAFQNKNEIDLIYSAINANPYIGEVLDFTSLNKVIELEILDKINEMPHFYSPELILIPIFDEKLNHEFIYDYLRTNLKWEKNLWKNEIGKMQNPISLYGHYFYHFTDFRYINHQDHLYYYYLNETGRIYLFDDTKKEFILNYALYDQKQYKSDLDINIMIEIVEKLINEDEDLIDYLHDHQMITDKTYKKLMK